MVIALALGLFPAPGVLVAPAPPAAAPVPVGSVVRRASAVDGPAAGATTVRAETSVSSRCAVTRRSSSRGGIIVGRASSVDERGLDDADSVRRTNEARTVRTGDERSRDHAGRRATKDSKRASETRGVPRVSRQPDEPHAGSDGAPNAASRQHQPSQCRRGTSRGRRQVVDSFSTSPRTPSHQHRHGNRSASDLGASGRPSQARSAKSARPLEPDTPEPRHEAQTASERAPTSHLTLRRAVVDRSWHRALLPTQSLVRAPSELPHRPRCRSPAGRREVSVRALNPRALSCLRRR